MESRHIQQRTRKKTNQPTNQRQQRQRVGKNLINEFQAAKASTVIRIVLIYLFRKANKIG